CSLSKSIPICTTQQKYIVPWLGFQLLYYSLLQSLPETIETAWPPPLCPPRFERCRTGQGSGLLGKLAVCRCFRGALRSASRIASIKPSPARASRSHVPVSYVQPEPH